MITGLGNRLDGIVNRRVFGALQCLPVAISYDYASRIGYLSIEGDGCSDMDGCIDYFVSIDPDVEVIYTSNAFGDGVAYIKRAGAWIARECKHNTGAINQCARCGRMFTWNEAPITSDFISCPECVPPSV